MIRTRTRVIVCRDFLNENGCTLYISGSTKEVFNVALRHAIEEHGHQDTPELRKQIKVMMKNGTPKNPGRAEKSNSK